MALLERIAPQFEPVNDKIAGCDIEYAIDMILANDLAIGTGTWLTVAELKTQVAREAGQDPDDNTEIDNLVAVVNGESQGYKKVAAANGIKGALGLVNSGELTPAQARTRIGIPTP